MNDLSANLTRRAVLINTLLAVVSLFFNGMGIHLTIRAGIGAGPWDVFNLGLSKTFGILYGNASITVAFIILIIDILMKEPIGISMFIDAIVVGKAVDFFDRLNIFHTPNALWQSVVMMLVGLVIMGYTQCFYMKAALGCGPRDTLLVGLARHLTRIPIGVISIGVLCMATLVGWLLGGPVGLGTLICAFCAGPIMQMAFQSLHFDATGIRHQPMQETFAVFHR